MSIAIIKSIELIPLPPGRGNGWQFVNFGLEVVGLDRTIIANGSIKQSDHYSFGAVAELSLKQAYGKYKFSDIQLIAPENAAQKIAEAREVATREKIESESRTERERREHSARIGKERLENAKRIVGETISKAEENGEIAIDATISKITRRHGNGYIRAQINNDGFTAIRGIPYACFQLEKGIKVRVTGMVNDEYGRRVLDFQPSGLIVLDRSYCDDPKLRAVQRACKSFTATRLDTLQWELGERWIDIILNDPWIAEREKTEEWLKREYGTNWRKLATKAELEIFYQFPRALNRPPFERWPIETKQGAVPVAEALKALTPVKLDLLKINNPSISNTSLKRIIAPKPIDPKVFVRQGKMSFSQADDLIRLQGDNFRETLPRVIGTIWDALRSGEDDGHSALSVEDLRERARLQYGYSLEEIDAAIEKAEAISYFETQEEFDHSLYSIGKGKDISLAFRENARIEISIKNNLYARTGEQFSIEYSDDEGLDLIQNNAVRMALNNAISIITGGPGTGKTTICAKIGEKLDSVLGLAVAARAARNLSEKTDIESRTIASYLIQAGRGRTPNCETLIIDEASMVGSKDMNEILQCAAEAGTKRIILVGDKDQLFPIDWGSPFADIIEANAIPITRLEKLYRTAENGGIALLASHFRDKLPLRPYYGNVVSSNVDEERIGDKAIAEYRHLIKQGLEPRDIGLVTSYVKDHYSYAAHKLNSQIREMLIKAGKLKGDINYPIVGDLVIGTKNHRTPRDKHDYLNGQRGIVIEASTRELGIQFDGNDEPEYFDQSELLKDNLPNHISYGYATTIHKSQGGEYAHVIAVVPKNINFTFGKRGLYTAITRAKQTLTIIGTLDIIPDIMEQDEERRSTVLKSLLGLSLDNKSSIKHTVSIKPSLNTGINQSDIKARLNMLERKLKDSADMSDEDLLTAMEANG